MTTTDARFHRCLDFTLKEEGHYVDHPLDPGGATMLGITQATLSSYRGKEVTKREVASLTEGEARQIYRAMYWRPVAGDALPPGIDLVVFDYGVNSGPKTAAKALQRTIGVEPDGDIGPVTLAALKQKDLPSVITAMCAYRLTFLKSLNAFKTFGRGWTSRVQRVETAALSFLNT